MMKQCKIIKLTSVNFQLSNFSNFVSSRFFQPSIVNLRETNKLFCLCLSNGNADGLGRIREKELELSCKRLGFFEAPSVIDDSEL